jgi:hypothetical protein
MVGTRVRLGRGAPAPGAGALVWSLPLAFGLLAALYGVITPAWEAPDEVAHFAYVKQLLVERSPPVQQVGVLGVAHHPPLYYLLAAAAAAPADLSDPSGAFRPNPRFVWAGQGGRDVNAARHTTAETFPYAGHALALHLGRLVSALLGALTVALVIPFAVIAPAYPIVAEPKLSLLAVERPLGVPIGDEFELAGYNVLFADADDRAARKHSGAGGYSEAV